MTRTARIPKLNIYFFVYLLCSPSTWYIALHLLALLPAPLHVRPLASFPLSPPSLSPGGAELKSTHSAFLPEHLVRGKPSQAVGLRCVALAARQSLERHRWLSGQPWNQRPWQLRGGKRERELVTQCIRATSRGSPGSVANANPKNAKRPWGRASF